MDPILVAIAAIAMNNILLTGFLGLCPYIGVSGEYASASGMGMAVIFVLTITVPANWLVNHFLLAKDSSLINTLILQPLGLPAVDMTFLQFITFIVIIASLVQIVEMFMKRFMPPLYNSLGIYLPLITVNCAIFGAALLAIPLWKLDFIESAAFGLGGGIGWALAIIAMAAIRERLRWAPIPAGFQGPAIVMIIIGLMAMGFMGFSGMISIKDFGG